MIPTVSVPSIQGRTGEPGSDTSTFEHQTRPYRRINPSMVGNSAGVQGQSQTITRSARARSMAHVSGFQSRLRSL